MLKLLARPVVQAGRPGAGLRPSTLGIIKSKNMSAAASFENKTGPRYSIADTGLLVVSSFPSTRASASA